MLTIYPVLQFPSIGKGQAFYNLRRRKYLCSKSFLWALQGKKTKHNSAKKTLNQSNQPDTLTLEAHALF